MNESQSMWDSGEQGDYQTESCCICYEDKIRHFRGIDTRRPQEICYDCWYNHILSTVSRITYRVGDNVLSPFNDGGSMDVVECLNSLKKEQALRIEEALFTKYSSFTKDIEKCPSESCDFVYVGEKCKWNHPDNVFNCPKCDMPLAPNSALSFKNMFARFYLLLSNKCPKCEIPIEKISGCPHMTCPCGHHFCWYCYKDHPSGGGTNRVYTIHNVRECVFIMLSKVALLLICLSSLLITFNGNSTIKFCLGLIGTAFSILVRALIIDVIILLQFIFVMMKKKRRRPYPSRLMEDKKLPTILALIAFNIAFVGVLHLVDELNFFLLVLVGECSVVGLATGLGYAIIFSIENWFQFIA